jgi:hypothetical protein
MTTIRTYALSCLLPSLLLMTPLARTDVSANQAGSLASWVVEQGTEEPSYAVVEPAATNLNIDTVVLACEEAWGHRVLQLQLYLTDDGPLRPQYFDVRPFKDSPRAEISIDDTTFPVALLFADDYVVLADIREGPFPLLSEELLDAMQMGMTMILRFDMLRERPGESQSFDSEAVVDLRAPGGRQAIASMRRCAEDLRVNSSLSTPAGKPHH